MSAEPSEFTPAYLQQAYDLTYRSQTGGVGDTVAIVDAYDDRTAESDLATFRSANGLPPCTTASGCFKKVDQQGQASPLPSGNVGWEGEEALDTDSVSSLCPNCHILLVEANSENDSDLVAAEQTAAQLGANQITNSWSGGGGFAASEFTFAGVSVIAATGDSGYLAGGNSYPASLPNVIAAGGTSLTLNAGGLGGRGFSESAWSLNSHGMTGWGGSSGCNTSESRPSYQPNEGCNGRAFADLSADADPYTGLYVFDAGNGGWQLYGGTSLSSPLIAAYEAVTGVGGSTPQWAYSDSALLNDPTSGSSGACPSGMLYICNAGVGYDGPTGIGSISGDVVAGAPGIGGPSVAASDSSNDQNGYATSVTASSATLVGGIYPNGLATSHYWQYGTSTSYGQQTQPANAGSSATPVLTNDTLTGLLPATVYHYRMVATNADGTAYGYDSQLTTLQGPTLPPVNTVAPAITGTATQGQSLTVSQGTWNPGGSSYSYQWQRSTDSRTWTAIAGATGTTYALASTDLGALIRVAVTATNSVASPVADTSSVGPVTVGAPVNTALPVITGTTVEGQSLSVSQGTWNPAGSSYAYQWQRSTDGGDTWTKIGGATGTTYTLASADTGALIDVAVSATNSASTVADAGPVGPVVAGPPVNTSSPDINGNATQGQSLTVSTGSWKPAASSYAYQWQRSTGSGATWTAISGAMGTTYTLGSADVGAQIRVAVSATNSAGSATANAAAVGPIAHGTLKDLTAPGISGSVQRTFTLSSSTGTWSLVPSSYAYQWERSTNGGGKWANIKDAITSAYVVASADLGALLRVNVTATNAAYGSVSVASAAVGPVAKNPPLNTAAPTVSGDTQRGSKLTGTTGTWAGDGLKYSYQWQRSANGSTWTNIASATATTRTVAVADEGDRLRLLVTAKNSDGSASDGSAPVGPATKNLQSSTSAPTVSGSAQRGLKLTGTTGSWSGDGLKYSYQWQRSAAASAWVGIPSATSSTYTVAVADERDTLRLLVTATGIDGAVSAASAAVGPALANLPASTVTPKVSGTARPAAKLTGTAGSWSGLGNAYTYQWQRSRNGVKWTDITAATTKAYTITPADETSQLRLLVTATNPDATVTASSTPTYVQPSSPVGASVRVLARSRRRRPLRASSP